MKQNVSSNTPQRTDDDASIPGEALPKAFATSVTEPAADKSIVAQVLEAGLKDESFSSTFNPFCMSMT